MAAMAGRRRVALITGASEGIGAELARIMGKAGHDLVLAARRGERLEALAGEIEANGGKRPLVHSCDLSQPAGIDSLLSALETAGVDVEILVNNAGYGLLGQARELDRDAQLGIVDLNIRALTDLTLRLLPQIVARRGRILQVASIAAFLPGPGMAVYYASKAYVLSFGQALAQELKGTGAHVTTLCPGPTATGFQERAGLDLSLFKFMRPEDARSVAQAGYSGMMAGKRVVVPGTTNKVMALLAGLAPDGMLLSVIGRLQESRKA